MPEYSVHYVGMPKSARFIAQGLQAALQSRTGRTQADLSPESARPPNAVDVQLTTVGQVVVDDQRHLRSGQGRQSGALLHTERSLAVSSPSHGRAAACPSLARTQIGPGERPSSCLGLLLPGARPGSSCAAWKERKTTECAAASQCPCCRTL